MINQKIGSFIAELRKERGLTQEQLAEKLGVTNRSISRWENGNTLPDLSLMQGLSAVLDVSMAELLNGQRANADEQLEKGIVLALELAQKEKERLRRNLNLRFGCGFAFLLIAGLHSSLGVLSFISPPSRSVFLWFCIVLGLVFFIAGFCSNNKIRPVSKGQIAVFATAESDLRMKTADEMLQFSRKYQHGERKQHSLAFSELERHLQDDEYAVFTFIGDSCTINDSPGPWHISAAITNKQILLSGETIRGRMMTTFATGNYDRKALKSLKLKGSKLILHLGETVIKIDGHDFDSIIDKLKKFL